MDYLSYHCDYEIKGTGTDRSISGYGSFFGNVDAAGDIVSTGAFKASLAKAKSGETQWPVMLLQHSSTDLVGVWDVIEEDQHGLKVTGRLASSEEVTSHTTLPCFIRRAATRRNPSRSAMDCGPTLAGET